jgi:hypothetical protein
MSRRPPGEPGAGITNPESVFVEGGTFWMPGSRPAGGFKVPSVFSNFSVKGALSVGETGEDVAGFIFSGITRSVSLGFGASAGTWADDNEMDVNIAKDAIAQRNAVMTVSFSILFLDCGRHFSGRE